MTTLGISPSKSRPVCLIKRSCMLGAVFEGLMGAIVKSRGLEKGR